MSVRWRIIDAGAMGPYSNMAFDEALLRGYRWHSSPPTLRIYRWSRPSLSLGYSQRPERELDIDLCRKMSIPYVRRITGGGIILHGNELTYSLIGRKEELGITSRVAASYKIICRFLIAFYDSLGIKAGFACDASLDEDLGRPSALCFAAKEKYDIVVGGRKIGGNAQKRSGEIVFQHGSIPLNFDSGRASSFLRIKESPGCESGALCLPEILGEDMDAQEMAKALKSAFINSFDVLAAPGGLSDAEAEIFTALREVKYESANWNYSGIDTMAMSQHAARQ